MVNLINELSLAFSSEHRSQIVGSSPRALIQRYAGACNVQTDIKEACFIGDTGGYIAAGSDDGRCGGDGRIYSGIFLVFFPCEDRHFVVESFGWRTGHTDQTASSFLVEESIPK